MELEIRRALPGDAVTLTEIAIAAKSYWGYPKHWIDIWRPELTFMPEYFEKNESWAAGVDGQLAGFYTLLEKDGNGWLENLWVKPVHIGQGIGTILFKHSLGKSKQRGYRVLRLESDPNAFGFYQKMGAHQVGERYSDVDGQPRILPIMEIEL